MNKNIFTSIALAGAALLGLAAGQASTAVGTLGSGSEIITADTTWTTAGSPYILNTIVYLGNGTDLTIQPGVVIQGVADSADGNTANNNPGTLVVARNAKIYANGTPDQPIVFTGTSDENVVTFNGTANATWTTPNNGVTGTWGGLVILGKTYVSATDASDNNFSGNNTDGGTVEGITDPVHGRYGGLAGDTCNDNDGSGELSFISVRYAGEVIGTSNEINGVTLAAVGRNTLMHHIEIINALDDAIEWFGGTVNMKYLATINSGDDCYDWDMGFRGKGQFWFAIQGGNPSAAKGSGLGDKVGELDGPDKGDDNVPFSVPTIYNLTAIGMTPGNETGVSTQHSGLYFRDASGGRFFNSLFLSLKNGALAIEKRSVIRTTNNLSYGDCTTFLGVDYSVLPTNPDVGSFYDHNSEGAKILAFDQDEVWNGYNNNWQIAREAGNATLPNHGSGNGDMDSPAYYNGTVSGFTDLGNTVAALPIVSLTQYNATVDSAGNKLFFTSSVDPRAANSATSTTRTPADAFFTAASYKGAFAPNSNWMAGWSLAAKIGQVVTSNGTTASIVGDRFAFEFTSVAGNWYLVQSSTDMSTWTTIDSVQATGTTTVYLDDVNLGTKKFYRVIKL